MLPYIVFTEQVGLQERQKRFLSSSETHLLEYLRIADFGGINTLGAILISGSMLLYTRVLTLEELPKGE